MVAANLMGALIFVTRVGSQRTLVEPSRLIAESLAGSRAVVPAQVRSLGL